MPKQRLEYIDFAKGFAILSIVIFHYCQPYVDGIWGKAIMVGGTGVHLFFVLSGFGLGLSAKVPAVSFYKKRFIKILIPYYVVIIAIYCVNIVYPIYGKSSLYALCGHLFFYKMFDESIIGSFGYQFWFLSTIIQFYLVFPVISWIRERMTGVGFVFLSVFISASYWVLLTYFDLAGERRFNSFFLQYLWEFNIGIVLAQLYRDKKRLFWVQSNLVLSSTAVVGIVVMALMALKGGVMGQTFNDIPASVGYLSLSAFLFSMSQKTLRFFKVFLIFIGKLSFELYLIHMLNFLLLRDLIELYFANSGIVIALLVILPVTILVAHYLHKVFALLLANIVTGRPHSPTGS